MRVVYKPHVIEQLMRARTAADLAGKEIEKVVLSVREARSLLSDINYRASNIDDRAFKLWLDKKEALGSVWAPQPPLRLVGIDIEVVT